MGANIPGKKREQMVYLAGVDVYNKTVNEALKEWRGFEIKRQGGDVEKMSNGVKALEVTPEPIIG
jgi:hypothetical protein